MLAFLLRRDRMIDLFALLQAKNNGVSPSCEGGVSGCDREGGRKSRREGGRFSVL
jgi:hypothetical protein